MIVILLGLGYFAVATQGYTFLTGGRMGHIRINAPPASLSSVICCRDNRAPFDSFLSEALNQKGVAFHAGMLCREVSLVLAAHPGKRGCITREQ